MWDRQLEWVRREWVFIFFPRFFWILSFESRSPKERDWEQTHQSEPTPLQINIGTPKPLGCLPRSMYRSILPSPGRWFLRLVDSPINATDWLTFWGKSITCFAQYVVWQCLGGGLHRFHHENNFVERSLLSVQTRTSCQTSLRNLYLPL